MQDGNRQAGAEGHSAIVDQPLLLYGTIISTFVRKVLLALAFKGLDHKLAMPPRDELLRLNPLGQVPVLRVGETVVIDSSVICALLEQCWPAPPIYPADPLQRAQALWIEEYADTALQAPLFTFMNEILFKPKVYGKAADPAVIEQGRAAAGEPLDYLETQLGGAFFVGDAPTVADFTMMAVLGNPLLAGFELDPARWPRLAAYAPRMLAQEPFAGVWSKFRKVYEVVDSGAMLRK